MKVFTYLTILSMLAIAVSAVYFFVQLFRKKPLKKPRTILLSCIAAFVLFTVLAIATAHTHTWQEATCAEPKTCTSCGETEGEPLGHTWVDATCTKPKTCTVCGETEGSALGHKWKDATCTEPKTCTVCGETDGKALGHSVKEWTILQEATCTEKGTQSGVCTVCGENVEEDIPLKEHTPGDWVVTEYPTEYSKGTRVKYCTVCNAEIETEKFEMTADEIEQAYKNSCESISYKNLERTPGEYTGHNVKFYGRVVQVCSEAKSVLYYSTYRVATSGRYDNVVYLSVDNYGSGSRILEGDYITFYGEYAGLYTYETVRGDSLSIPKIVAKYVD